MAEHDETSRPAKRFAGALQTFISRFGELRDGKLQTDAALNEAASSIERTVMGNESARDRPDIMFKWSAGKGVWASVPWFALLDKRITTSTQRGVYIVLLVAQDLSCAYLTLNQGMTELVTEHKQSGAVALSRSPRAESGSVRRP
jgi:hypothetical protein